MGFAKTCIGQCVLGSLLLLASMGVAVSQTTAQPASQAVPEAILLWDKEAPRATGDSLEDKPAVYPYLPDAAKNTGAAVLVCPGGANQTRCVDFEGVLIAQWFRQRGIAAFVLRYRVGPLYTGAEARLDAQRGVQFLRAHAAKFKVAPDRIGTIGFSAGASNICGAAFSAIPGKPDASDPVERVSSSPNFLIPVYGGGAPPEQTKAPLPPTFMFCTAEDGCHKRHAELVYKFAQEGSSRRNSLLRERPSRHRLCAGDPVLGEWPKLLYNWMQLKGFLTGEKRPRRGNCHPGWRTVAWRYHRFSSARQSRRPAGRRLYLQHDG